ncbi:MAG: YbgC/FadM family acyl-CoA thioesterase [Hyphomonadaceae bacterium]
MEQDRGEGHFCGREHILPLRIYYEDTDFSGVVYHANYVRYLERGRSEFIRSIGASHTAMLQCEAPVTFMVSRLDLRFVRPAKIDDRLDVRTLMEFAKGARVACRQTITRGGELILEALVENVCVSLDGRPRRIPRLLNERVAAYLPETVVVVANDLAERVLVAAE